MKTCEFRNFTTCLEWAQEGERLCRENKLNQGIECLQKALKIGSEDMRTLSAVYCQLGNAYFSLRNYDKSVEFHSYDMMLARLLKDTSGEAKACGNIGNAFKIQGSFHDALTFTKRQLELSRQIGDKMCEARALYNLGSVYHMKGKQTGRMLKAAAGECSLLSLNSSASQPFLEDLKHAIEYYEENLVLVEEAGDALNCGRTYGNLGNTYYLLRDFETAIQYHYKRLDVARQFGDKSAQRRAYSNLGNAHVFLSQMEKAIEFYRLALMLACEMKDRLAEAQSCFSLANAASLIADHHTAAEYHGRHLSMARALKDRAGEARAYTSLATDYRNIGDLPKAIYFLIKNRRIAREMHDSTMMETAEDTLRDVLKEGGDGLLDDCGEIQLDSSADPDGISCTIRLSRSLRSLSEEFRDCGLNRLQAYKSEGDLSGRLEADIKTQCGSSQDDFFEMLSRMQSKRLDEQRCDPSILSDVTNRKGPRQTDVLVISPSVSILSHEHEKKNRRLSLISRMTSSVFRDLKPVTTSTPFSSTSTKKKKKTMTNSFLRTPSFSRMSSIRSAEKRSPSMHSIRSTPEHDISVDTVASTKFTDHVFRVPQIPCKRIQKGKENRRHSMYATPVGDKNGTDALIDLLMNAQGRRMDEQRATLLPGLNSGGQAQEILEKLNGGSTRSELEGANAIDEHLIELLIRVQSQRMNEQRSELVERQTENTETEQTQPVTIPEDDISALVMRMQAGRLEEQRAHLQPQESG